MATLRTAPPRRSHREPAYFYKSATAVIDGDVRFSEGCVVLPHARIVVPPGYRLLVGPFTLLAEFAELRLTVTHGGPTTVPSSRKAAADPFPVYVGSHNHIQSYASLRFELSHAAASHLSSSAAVKPLRRIELMGTGNVFQSFASLHACLTLPEEEGVQLPSHAAWQLGDFNVCGVHAHVYLSLPEAACVTTPAFARQQPPREEEVVEEGVCAGGVASPAPTMPPLENVQRGHHLDATRPPSVDPSMPGRVSVEERLFQKNSSDDDSGDACNTTTAAGKLLDDSPLPTSSGTAAAASAAAIPRLDNQVFICSSATLGSSTIASSAAREAEAFGVPRYGTRSVAELPTIIKRILEDEKQRREAGEAHPSGADAASEPPSPIAAAAAALTSLKGYVESVHPDLRAHTEERTRTEAELLCRFYIHQYIEDRDLYPVDSQHDDETAFRHK